MKNIIIAQLEKPSRQWQAWIRALDDAGFGINMIDPLSLELQVFHARSGDVVLMDGMLGNLSRYIKRLASVCLDAPIIVATDIDSFSIKYEVMQQHGAIYVSGPMPADQFAATIQRIVMQEKVA